MRTARIAFYLLLVLGIVSLLAIPWNPVGLIQGPVFLAAAFGIRRQRAWSAYGPALLILVLSTVPLATQFLRGPNAEMVAVAAIFSLSIVLLLFLAGRAMERAYGRRGMAWPWISGSAIAASIFLFFGLFQMPTGSMENTLLVGDHIAVLKTHGKTPARGELVTHVYPVNRDNVFVKRVVAIPGDHVKIVNKQLFVNGAAVKEPYAEHTTSYVDNYRDNFPSEPNVPLYPQGQEMLVKNVMNGEVVVPAGHYFVLGDNRDSSLDSRYWGFIENSDIIGTPKMVYYSVDPGVKPTGAERRLPILNVRWSRLFHRVG